MVDCKNNINTLNSNINDINSNISTINNDINVINSNLNNITFETYVFETVANQKYVDIELPNTNIWSAPICISGFPVNSIEYISDTKWRLHFYETPTSVFQFRVNIIYKKIS